MIAIARAVLGQVCACELFGALEGYVFFGISKDIVFVLRVIARIERYVWKPFVALRANLDLGKQSARV